MTTDPQQIVEEIRKRKFGLGLTARRPVEIETDLHEAIALLSTLLYQKDLHFAMELLQVVSKLCR